MKSTDKTFQHSRNGGASIALLLIAFLITVSVASYLKLSTQNFRLSHNTIEYQRARILAESVLDAASAQLSTSLKTGAFNLISSELQDQLDEAASKIRPGLIGDNDEFEMALISMQLYSSNGWESVTKNDGKEEDQQKILILAGVRNPNSGVSAAVSKMVRITREPFLRYAIFYDDMLELHPGPSMIVNGDMRSNSQIELWCGKGLTFEGKVVCPGTIELFKSDKDDDYSTEERRAGVASKIQVKVSEDTNESFYQDNSVLDSRHPNWTPDSQSVWDGKVTAGSEVVKIVPPIKANNHSLIEPIYPSTDTAQLKAEKLAYKADTYITVKRDGSFVLKYNGTIIPTPPALIAEEKADNGNYQVNNAGFINVHKDYYDPRESEGTYENIKNPEFQNMQMVDIYADKLLEAVPDAKIVYIEMEDRQNANKPKPAVRLRNSEDLSAAGSDGLSFATHRTMYVEGDFNSVKNAAGIEIESKRVPALIAADNLTLLSNNWDDNNSKYREPGMNGQGVKASETALNAAVMIGYSDPNNEDAPTPTGGAHNLIRFRENWSDINYNFSGSYISLWAAEDSHCIYSGKFYTPPNRNISYDEKFKTLNPPGMPYGYSEAPIPLHWQEISLDKALELADSGD